MSINLISNKAKRGLTRRITTEGFTILELLLYVSLSAVILLTATLFMNTLLEARVKNQTIATVNGEGDQVMHLITQTLRNATAINSPATGATSTTLSLNTPDPLNNPTVFDMSGGVIRISEGGGSPVALTSNLVTASNLSFRNLTRPGTPGSVHTTFTLTHVH